MTVHFPNNSPLLKSCSFTKSNFSYFLIFILSLSLNFTIVSFAFSKFSFLFHILFSTINLFYHTKYLAIFFIFPLFNIFSTSYSLTLFSSTSLISSTFCFFTCSLYLTTWLTFITKWIFIEVSCHSLTILVETILLIIYRPIYQFINFFAGFFLNTRYFILNITLFSFFHSFASLLSLFAYCFISFCVFLSAIPASSYTFFILSVNSVAFSTFSFLLIFAPIFISLL